MKAWPPTRTGPSRRELQEPLRIDHPSESEGEHDDDNGDRCARGRWRRRRLQSGNREEGLLLHTRFLESVRADEIPQVATASKSRTYNKEWIDALELKNMVQLLDMAAACAFARTETG